MKQNKTKKQNAAALAEQDLQLYRLYLLFAVALVGFSVFRFLPTNFFYIFHGVGTWIVTVLLLFALGAFIYIRRYLKPDESKKVITSSGIAYFLIPTLFMLAFYGYFSNAGVKFQIAFAMLSVYAIIYNIYKNNFRVLTAVVFIALSVFIMFLILWNSFPTVGWNLFSLLLYRHSPLLFPLSMSFFLQPL